MKHVILSIAFLLAINTLAQKVNTVYYAEEVMEGDGAKLLRLFPAFAFKHADPFILLDDFSVQPPAGFSDHPHKGFEAITYMIDGGFIHKDNLGNNDAIFAGGAQHFVAGSGLIHSEMPGTAHMNRGLQLWLNIPVVEKNAPPAYQKVDSIPIKQYNNNIIVRTVVGSNSPVSVACGCNLQYLDVSIKKDSISFSPAATYTSFIYVIEGEISINKQKLAKGQFYFLQAGSAQQIESITDSRFVYLSAKPLNQRIKQRGPYVY